MPARRKWAVIVTNAGTTDKYTTPHFSAQFHLFPFCENAARYDAVVHSDNSMNVNGVYRGGINSTPAVETHPARKAIQGRIPGFICPSDPSVSSAGLGDRDLAKCNIMTCRGEFLTHLASINRASAATPAISNGNAARAPFMMTCMGNDEGGTDPVTMRNYWKGLEAVSDGTSNTMAASEAVTAENSDTQSIFGGVIRMTITLAMPNNTPPQDCLNMLSPGDRRYYAATGSGNTHGMMAAGILRGGQLCDARAARTGFSANLPPNSPACVETTGNAWEKTGFFPATSQHSGGVNVVLFDGSVRFVSNTVNTGLAVDTQAPIGIPSPYGVWGAMATTSLAETASM